MNRDYIYHEATLSLCSECLQPIPAKIILKEGSVFVLKNCPKHGEQEELLEEDAEYHLNKRKFDKPGTFSQLKTEIKQGCPFDCGLCPQHDQHTCIGLIEVTNQCDLGCPLCYAKSGQGEFLSLEQIEKMLDFYVESEGGEAEILQISGGEPTLHPQIIQIIKLARKKKIRYVMLNTNGIKIAEDAEFVKEIAQCKGKFEVYLQFDGFTSEVYKKLRGKDLLKTKQKAIANLQKFEIPVTLVTTVQQDLNEDEIGQIISFGMEQKNIRGVNLQPIGYFGRLPDNINIKKRLTLSGVIRRIEKQLPEIFQKSDIIPLPCNVERVAVTYLARNSEGKFIPITRKVKVQDYLPLVDNTFAFDADKILKQNKLNCEGIKTCNCLNFLNDLKSIIPLNFALKSKQEKLNYVNENTFRISITSFVDVYNFDLKSMQKECVHVITPDLKKIPFSAYNMFHRK